MRSLAGIFLVVLSCSMLSQQAHCRTLPNNVKQTKNQEDSTDFNQEGNTATEISSDNGEATPSFTNEELATGDLEKYATSKDPANSADGNQGSTSPKSADTNSSPNPDDQPLESKPEGDLKEPENDQASESTTLENAEDGKEPTNDQPGESTTLENAEDLKEPANDQPGESTTLENAEDDKEPTNDQPGESTTLENTEDGKEPKNDQAAESTTLEDSDEPLPEDGSPVPNFEHFKETTESTTLGEATSAGHHETKHRLGLFQRLKHAFMRLVPTTSVCPFIPDAKELKKLARGDRDKDTTTVAAAAAA